MIMMLGKSSYRFSLLVKQKSTMEHPRKKLHRPGLRRNQWQERKRVPTYNASDIQVLEGIAAIRHRPGMYIGSTSTSCLLHLIWEALDNAVDEAVAGFGKHIWMSIDREGWVTVKDEAGRPLFLCSTRGITLALP